MGESGSSSEEFVAVSTCEGDFEGVFCGITIMVR